MSWLHLAVGSGLAAAFNGLFAKLTTTVLTTSLSSSIARLFSLPADSKIVEYVVRGVLIIRLCMFMDKTNTNLGVDVFRAEFIIQRDRMLYQLLAIQYSMEEQSLTSRASQMWGLFTAALAKGPTATKVSIVNTSANFMVCPLPLPPPSKANLPLSNVDNSIPRLGSVH